MAPRLISNWVRVRVHKEGMGGSVGVVAVEVKEELVGVVWVVGGEW